MTTLTQDAQTSSATESFGFPLLSTTARERDFAQALLQRAGWQLPGPLAAVCAEDEMTLHLRSHLSDPDLTLSRYLNEGLEAVQVLEHVLQQHGRRLADCDSLLDFACGYGKSTRFLVQRLDPARVWVSDIYRGAVDFQRAHFGVQGLYSVADPDALMWPRRFSLIYVGSLFSHLPEQSFVGWLRKLSEALADDGLLVFSTHGPMLAQAADAAQTGFHFLAKSESRSLDTAEYGSTFVTEAWVRCRAAALGLHGVHYLPSELWAQDLYVVSRQPLAQAPLEPNRHPLACVDQAWVQSGGQLVVSGWAFDRLTGGPIGRVEVGAAGLAPWSAKLGQDRPDVAAHFQRADVASAGWSLTMRAPKAWFRREAPPPCVTITFTGLQGVQSHQVVPLEVRDGDVPAEAGSLLRRAWTWLRQVGTAA